LVEDLQNWLNNPAANFGWMLISDSEGVEFTARRFASREDSVNSPILTVQYSSGLNRHIFTFDQNPSSDPELAGAMVAGTHAYTTASGGSQFWSSGVNNGVNGNPNSGGYLALCDATNNNNSLVFVFPDLENGLPSPQLQIDLDVRVGNGAAEQTSGGFSISYARAGDPSLVNATNGLTGGFAGGDSLSAAMNTNGSSEPENGTRTGISVIFDAGQGNYLPDTPPYDGSSPNPSEGHPNDREGIAVRVDNKTLAQIDLANNRNWKDCESAQGVSLVQSNLTDGFSNLPYGPGNTYSGGLSLQTGTNSLVLTGAQSCAATFGAVDTSGSFTNLGWGHLMIRLTNDLLAVGARFTVAWKGTTILDTRLHDFTPITGRLVIAARTFTNAQNLHVDNLSVITTTKTYFSDAPFIVIQPTNQWAYPLSSIAFTVKAIGTPPLQYQWTFNGENIAGATDPTLTLNILNVQFWGAYAVAIQNSQGRVISANAFLAGGTDAANGNTPEKVITPPCNPPSGGKDSLVLITHGWTAFDADISWIKNMKSAIESRIPSNWEVRTLDWTNYSKAIDPNIARAYASIYGNQYGRCLSQFEWKNVHLIAHSAGSALIEGISEALLTSGVAPQHIQETFLDPFTGTLRLGRFEYGAHATWADNYFAFDPLTDFGGTLLTFMPYSTSGPLDWTYNVDIAGTIDTTNEVSVYSSGIANSTPPLNITHKLAAHDSAIYFYSNTINGTVSECVSNNGFPLSIEMGGAANWPLHPRSNSPISLCEDLALVQDHVPTTSNPPIDFSLTPAGASTTGVILDGAGARLSTDDPAWISLGITVTNKVNFVQFEQSFSDTNKAEGLLSVFWNTNLIGTINERPASSTLQTYRFPLPGTIAEGLYALCFRLDSFANDSETIVTNVATGFAGLGESSILMISMEPTKPTPVLTASGTLGFTYSLQSSTDLTHWTTAALLVNTNGSVVFPAPHFSGMPYQFYRVLSP
jgi:hypothetical protein